MTISEKIRFLLRVATRAEDEGNDRVARNFRRMAEDARPLGDDRYASGEVKERSA